MRLNRIIMTTAGMLADSLLMHKQEYGVAVAAALTPASLSRSIAGTVSVASMRSHIFKIFFTAELTEIGEDTSLRKTSVDPDVVAAGVDRGIYGIETNRRGRRPQLQYALLDIIRCIEQQGNAG